MSVSLNIKKGIDLNLEGGIPSSAGKAVEIEPVSVAVCPDDFPGLILRPLVKEGEVVKKGSPLLHDKQFPQIRIVSPVSGKVRSIVRGERRKILYVVVDSDSTSEAEKFSTELNSVEKIEALLCESGLWALLRQRPFGIVPRPGVEPRDIFVTALDTAPLAPDFDYLLSEQASNLEKGVELLNRFTKGKIYIGRRENSSIQDVKGAEMVNIGGPHPSGNAGTMIAGIAPVNKGEVVWTLDAMTLARIGALASTGIVDSRTTVAITGSEIEKPQYVSTIVGSDIHQLIEKNLKPQKHHLRIISGNVLTGHKVEIDGYLRYPYTQVTVIPEGDDVDEFMGWASVSPSKMSVSSSFPGSFLRRKFTPDARVLGGRRAMIMSGEYDSMIPMDIMAEYLLKAIISRDIDKMEQLGIYEVVPEDFALAEYADTSKLELQKIVADGIDFFRKETE